MLWGAISDEDPHIISDGIDFFGATAALDHDPPVSDYLEPGTYDLRVSVRETGTEGVRTPRR